MTWYRCSNTPGLRQDEVDFNLKFSTLALCAANAHLFIYLKCEMILHGFFTLVPVSTINGHWLPDNVKSPVR